MNNLNFKFYPPRLLITIILGLAILIQLSKQIILGGKWNWIETLWPLGLIGLLATIFTFFHKFVMWNWHLNLLGLTDIRGKYKGVLTSSFHEDDDPNKPNIRMNMELSISQNLNGIKIFGEVSPLFGAEGRTSKFESIWVKLTKMENDRFLLEYRYQNTSNKSHSWDKKYQLTSHTGWATLEYDPGNKTVDGFYNTYENQSRGKLELRYNGEI